MAPFAYAAEMLTWTGKRKFSRTRLDMNALHAVDTDRLALPD